MLSGPCGTGAGAVGMPVESAAGDQAAHVRALLLCGLGGRLVGLGLMPDPVGGGLLVVGGLAASVSLRGLVHWFRSSRRQRADPTAPARWPGSWHRPTLSELTAATGPLRARGRW